MQPVRVVLRLAQDGSKDGERSRTATADVRPYLEKADEPDASLRQSTLSLAMPGQESGEAEHESIQRRRKAQRESNWTKTGHTKGPMGLIVGLHDRLNACT